jgi:hypothetical protein
VDHRSFIFQDLEVFLLNYWNTWPDRSLLSSAASGIHVGENWNSASERFWSWCVDFCCSSFYYCTYANICLVLDLFASISSRYRNVLLSARFALVHTVTGFIEEFFPSLLLAVLPSFVSHPQFQFGVVLCGSDLAGGISPGPQGSGPYVDQNCFFQTRAAQFRSLILAWPLALSWMLCECFGWFFFGKWDSKSSGRLID